MLSYHIHRFFVLVLPYGVVNNIYRKYKEMNLKKFKTFFFVLSTNVVDEGEKFFRCDECLKHTRKLLGLFLYRTRSKPFSSEILTVTKVVIFINCNVLTVHLLTWTDGRDKVWKIKCWRVNCKTHQTLGDFLWLIQKQKWIEWSKSSQAKLANPIHELCLATIEWLKKTWS